MITVKLQGGLGNQMFQYALGRAVSERLGTKLILDLSFYLYSGTQRKFELDAFNIKASIRKPGFFSRIYEKLFWHSKIIREKREGFDADMLHAPDGSILVGDHWHSEKYFKDIEQKIRAELSLKEGPTGEARVWEDRISSNESASIHMRRSDYLAEKHLKIFGVLPIGYYQKAVGLIKEKNKTPVFFVFSDDISWAKENLKLPFPTEFVSDGNISAPEEMHLMSLCKNHIIANSSFSWWGAWLDSRPDKIVIAPKQWFSDTTKNSNDIVPESWIKI